VGILPNITNVLIIYIPIYYLLLYATVYHKLYIRIKQCSIGDNTQEVNNMTMKTEFEAGLNDKIINSCVKDVKEIWNKYDNPIPDQDITTSVPGMRPYCEPLEPEQQDVVDAFNGYVDQLYSLIDIFHIGSGIWYTHIKNTDEWDVYAEEAEEVIKSYIDENLWEIVCK